MKSLIAVVVLAGSFVLSGCVSTPPPKLVLDTVGPIPGSMSGSAPGHGALIVYSAYPQAAGREETTYRRYRSDYDIFTTNGILREAVINRAEDGSWNMPKTVELPVGRYRVRARAKGPGVVTVPVMISAGRVTEVQLGAGPGWPDPKPMARTNPVRLPDGQVAGWPAPQR